MKKKVLAALLALTVACMFALTGCMPGLSNATQKMPIMEASIDKVFTVGSYGGTKLLVVNLNVKNNTEVNLAVIGVQMYASATLDEKNLASSYISEDNPEALSWSANIAPNSEGPAQVVFELPASEGVVHLTMTVDSLDRTDMIVILDETFDLSGVEAVVSESEFEVKVTDAIITDDGEGKDILVLYVTFTNNSNSPISYGSAIGTELFQNDIALKSGYLPYKHPLADNDLSSNTYTDIKKGASIEVMLVFDLYDSKSPVEIKLIDRQSYDNAVLFEKTIQF